jgi:DNA-binding HxlR family transcriptional regulator
MTQQNSGPSEEQGKDDGQVARRILAADRDISDGIRWERVAEVLAAVRSVWAVPVLRHLSSGASRPKDLLRAVNADAEPGSRRLSSKVMYETLDLLNKDGLVSRAEVQGFPLETHYWPTHEGHTVLTEVSKMGMPYPGRWPSMAYVDPPAPPGVDPTKPSMARVWDALRGGRDNFETDREAMRSVLAEMPSLAEAARATRRFQNDAIRVLHARGVRQFLDIGTGLPTGDAVHETAQRLDPASRVVYVDNDPLVLVHATALLRSSPEGACAYVDADIREPGKILARAAETLDFEQPVAVLMMMILHFLADEDNPWGIVRRLMQGLRADRYLVIGHAGADIAPGPAAAAAAKYNETAPVPLQLRSHGEVARFFGEAGLEMLPPGLVPMARWWPGEEEKLPEDANAHVGIGWRPAQRSHTTA